MKKMKVTAEVQMIFYLANYKPGTVPNATTITPSDAPTYKKEGWFVLPEVFELETEFSHEQVVNQGVSILRETKEKIMADAGKRCTEIDRKINDLLSIENAMPQEDDDDAF